MSFDIIDRDGFLSGRLRIAQPETGYRAAIDPVLLAAACPAGKGDTILDAGCGVGTAALCTIERTSCSATGIEIQPQLAELARSNATANNAALAIVEGSILTPPDVIKQTRFDHVICNPPYLLEGYGSGEQSIANHEGEAKLSDWLDFAARRVNDNGTVVFIHRADRLDELLAEYRKCLGAVVIFPLWRRAGEEATRVIVGGIKGRKTPLRLAPGLALHQADGTYTSEADAILRGQASIDLWPL
jgi:tRNA1(Val) A37 N6-methylase TrmN6